MKKWEDNVLSGKPLNPIAGASVQVNISGGAAASLFSDAGGTIPLANPVTTDTNGNYWFYVANGLYDLIFSGAGLQTLTRVGVEILSDIDEVVSGTSGNLFVVTSGGVTAGAAATSSTIQKTVTGMADATYTDIFTVTVPNAAHAAMLKLDVIASLGAGGAVGAFEASRAASFLTPFTRTPGLATAGPGAGFTTPGSQETEVVGGTTIALAAQTSGITGANNATQTFKVQLRISKGGGSSNNHSCIVKAELINSQGSGITLS